LHLAARRGFGRGGLRATAAPGLPRLPHRHHHRPLRALSDPDSLAHVPRGNRERGGAVRRRRAALRAVLRRAREPAWDEDSTYRRESREAPEVGTTETFVPRRSFPGRFSPWAQSTLCLRCGPLPVDCPPM